MTTYRLPEVLGGGEAEIVVWKTDGYPSWATLEIDGVPVIVPHEHLAEVAAPLPPEPPVGSIVHLASYFGVYERLERGWLIAGEATGRAVEWDMLLRLNSGNAPVLLVPDPFAEPVELPWESNPPAAPEDRIMRTSVRVLSEAVEDCNDAGCHGIAVHLDPAGARAKARALWAAADAVEARAGAS